MAEVNIGPVVGATDTAGDTLTYTLGDTADDDAFAIVATSGQLQTKAALDFETQTSYMVTVTVTDGRDPVNTVNPEVDDTIRVTITVTDENEAPEFPSTIDPIEVAENTVPNANIGDTGGSDGC